MNSTTLTVRNKTAHKLPARDMNKMPRQQTCAHWTPAGERANRALDPSAFVKKTIDDDNNNNRNRKYCHVYWGDWTNSAYPVAGKKKTHLPKDFCCVFLVEKNYA